MKKIFFLLALPFAFAACQKDNNVSKVVKASYPTVTLSGSKFYSINVGGAAPTVAATAFDSTTGESYTPSLDASGIDVNTPGLYVVDVVATNKNGYIGRNSVYIAVTDVDPAMDLSGAYARSANGDTANVQEIANGLYLTDNVGGAPTLRVPAYFAVLNDSTIDLPLQTTPFGTVGVRTPSSPDDYGTLSLAPGDTSFSYRFNDGGAGFGLTAVRVFEKQ